MKVLVTGGKGGLGGELSPRWADDELILLGRDELDVTDPTAVSAAIIKYRPSLVIHAAAYTAVDKAEEEPELAEAVNVHGARNVAEAAADVGAAVIYPSTDFVFDGWKGSPYLENDHPNPLSVYGRTKLEGERAVREANPRSFVVRTSWLYSQTGKSFATTMLRLFGECAELTVVDDEISSPTYARDFAEALRRLVETNEYGTHHLSAAGETSWYGYAREIARQAGVKVTITPTTAAAYGAPAKRPAYSKLDCSKAAALGIEIPDWQDGLRRFFVDRIES